LRLLERCEKRGEEDVGSVWDSRGGVLAMNRMRTMKCYDMVVIGVDNNHPKVQSTLSLLVSRDAEVVKTAHT